jgi:electron transport complex protein RnfD
MTENYRVFDIHQRPQISLARSTAARMWLINLCAFIVIIQSSLSDSYSSLLVALSAVSAAVLTECFILHENGILRTLKDGSAVATALILVLLLPNNIFPLYAAIGAVFAIAVIKHSFGGLGSNWLNPAAGGWLFIKFCWPSSFKTASESLALSAAGAMEAGGFFTAATSSVDALRSFLNRSVFSLAGVNLPEGYLDLFGSQAPGIIADRGVLALLLGTIILTSFHVSRSWIPAVYLAVFGILVHVFGDLPFNGIIGNGDVLFSLCSGGTLAAAFFLSADPATGAKSNGGILLATVIGAVLTFIFRYLGSEPYGAVFAIVFINAMIPLIRIVESKKLYEKQRVST